MDKFAGSHSMEEMNFSRRSVHKAAASGDSDQQAGSGNGRFCRPGGPAAEHARGGGKIRRRLDRPRTRHSGADLSPAFGRPERRCRVSWHSPAETPSRGILRAKLESMRKTGADALKIATIAQSDEDNLRVLELIPLARKEFGIDLIAFCMGPAGNGAGW